MNTRNFIRNNKRKLTLEIQKQIDKNNKHLEDQFFYRVANKKEKKQLRAQQNTTPLTKWIEKYDDNGK